MGNQPSHRSTDAFVHVWNAINIGGGGWTSFLVGDHPQPGEPWLPCGGGKVKPTVCQSVDLTGSAPAKLRNGILQHPGL